MAKPQVERSFTEPYIRLTCRCGWTEHNDDVEDWAIERKRDRVVRKCTDCGEPVPEWEAFRPIDGVACLACGSLRESLAEAGFSQE
jgi:DNA-directed RNA polymerase subunit RPC12/RpoP